MVVFRFKEGVSLREAENAIQGLSTAQIRAKVNQLSAQYKEALPKGFAVDPVVTKEFLQSDFGKRHQRVLGLANWLLDYVNHGNSFLSSFDQAPSFINREQVIEGTKLVESMKDEPVTREISVLVKAQMVKNMTLPASEIISIRGVN